MKKKIVFILLILIFVIGIGFSLSNETKSLSIEIGNKVQEFDGEKIAEDILRQLDIPPRNSLYHISHWAGYSTLDFLPDGTIETLYWEMANKNDNDSYDVYQVRYQDNSLNIVNTDEVEKLDKNWGSIYNALITFEKLPWTSVLNTLPSGDRYTALITNIYNEGEKINRNPDINLYFSLEDGNLIKKNDDSFDFSVMTYEITFSVAQMKTPNFYRGNVEAVILVPIN